MSNKLYIEQDIQNIANSIRTKNGLSTLYKVSEMSGAINNLPVLSEDTIAGTTNTQVSLSNVVKDKELIVDGKAEQDGTPSPDSPKEISVVEVVSVDSVGKNFINMATVTDNKYINSTTGDVNNYSTGMATGYIEVEVGKSYYFSGMTSLNSGNTGAMYNENKEFVSGITSDINIRPLTIPSGVKYIRLSIWKNKYADPTNPKPMLAQSSTGVPYEPYKGITTPINLQGNFLGALPNGTKDELKIVDGRASIIKRIGKINSYNGETITGSYISTTGQLTTGATVYYELATPTNIDLGRIPMLTIDGTNNLTIYANLNTNFSLKYGKVI